MSGSFLVTDLKAYYTNIGTDVLDTEIKGDHLLASVLRWWHSLFLANPNDLKAQRFYTSTYVIRRGRRIHYNAYRSTIHPFSKFLMCWKFFIFILLLVYKLITTTNLSLVCNHISTMELHIGVCCEYLLLLDIVIHLFTGYEDKDRRIIVLDLRNICTRYMSTKSFFHVITSIPICHLLCFRYNWKSVPAIEKTNIFVCTLRIINLFWLLRFYEASKILNEEKSILWVAYVLKLLRILTLEFFTLTDLMRTALNLSLMKIIITQQDENSSNIADLFLSYLYRAETNGTVAQDSISFIETLKRNVIHNVIEGSMFMRITHIKVQKDPYDFFTAIIVKSFRVTIEFWFLIVCYGFVNAYTSAADRSLIALANTRSLLLGIKAPNKVFKNVNLHYKWPPSQKRITEKLNRLYLELPEPLTNEVKVYSYLGYFLSIKYFMNWADEIVKNLVMLANEDMFLPGSIVVDLKSKGSGLIVVYSGLLKMYDSEYNMVGQLIDGDHYGMAALVDYEATSEHMVVADKYTMVLILDVLKFREYMRHHPDLLEDLKATLAQELQDERLMKMRLLNAEKTDESFNGY